MPDAPTATAGGIALRSLALSVATAFAFAFGTIAPAQADEPPASPAPASPAPASPAPASPAPASPAPEPAPAAPIAPRPSPFSGRVLRKGDRVPVPGATVVLDGGAESTFTDGEGRFEFPTMTPGKHVVRVRGAGIDPVQSDETLNPGKRLEVTYFVSAKVRYRSTVRAARPVREVVEQTLDIEEIKHIPGTQGDALKAVQNLPGVARAPFGLGQLIVWGSSPEDTRVYVDGAYVLALYHFGGLRSTVNSEAVQSLTFIPGGYGAEYGRGLGGLVEVQTKKPREDGYHGFVQVDTIDGSFLVEGPITKKLSFGVSARRSWIDVFLPLVTSNQFQLSPKYWDYQARLRWRATPKDDLELLIFGSDDTVDLLAKNDDPRLAAQLHSHIYFHRLLGRYTHRWDGGSSLVVTPSLGYQVPFDIHAQFGNNTLSVSAPAINYDLRAVFRTPLSPLARLDVGLDFEGSRWDLAADSPAGGQPREGSRPAMSFDNRLTGTGTIFIQGLAPYVSLLLTDEEKKISLTTSLRLEEFFLSGDYLFSLPTPAGTAETTGTYHHSYFRPEARASARYQFNQWFALKGAFGLYHQAPDPGSIFGPFGNTRLTPRSGAHYVLGADAQPTPTLSISVEGFYKSLWDMIVASEQVGGPPLSNEGLGRVYGAEILIRQQMFKNFFGWFSYTISKSERKDHLDQDWRVFQYDQTHILTAIASYRLPRGYQFGLRFRYVTGNPYTPYSGSYVDLNMGRYTPISAPIYSGRLASFNQLDLRFDKTWTFNRWSLALYLDIQNLYNAHNPEGLQQNFDFTQTAPISGLPFFPALGLRGDF